MYLESVSCVLQSTQQESGSRGNHQVLDISHNDTAQYHLASSTVADMLHYSFSLQSERITVNRSTVFDRYKIWRIYYISDDRGYSRI